MPGFMLQDLYEIIAGSHLILVGRYFFVSIFRKRNVVKNFYLYHVVLITKVKDRQLIRSASEELFYSCTASEGMCSRVFAFSFDSFKPCDPKHSPLSLMATVTSASKKNSLPISGVIIGTMHSMVPLA